MSRRLSRHRSWDQDEENASPRVLTLALVGLPNVGKSTLLNRLVGRRVAIVDDRPGVTRDWTEHEVHYGPLQLKVLDTPGLDVDDPQGLGGRMRQAALDALDRADAVAWILDGRLGKHPRDSEVADLLRRSGKPIVLLVNKSEGQDLPPLYYEAVNFGLGDAVIPISGMHGDGMPDLWIHLWELAQPVAMESLLVSGEGDGVPEPPKKLRVAIIGRPNAGKSTLLNRLVGWERAMTGPLEGTTRDAMEVVCDYRGRKICFIDTAGVRKKSRQQGDAVELLSVQQTLASLRHADAVLLLCDAHRGLEQQELSLASKVFDEGSPIIVVMNKWDGVDRKPERLLEAGRIVERAMNRVRDVPVMPISALAGDGVEEVLDRAIVLAEARHRRLPTASLNRWLELVTASHPLPMGSHGRRWRIKYMVQVHHAPPIFRLFVSEGAVIPEHYERYLQHRLREDFDLPAIPLIFRWIRSRNPYKDGGK